MSSDFKTWWADYASGWKPHTTHDHEQHAERMAAFVWEHRDYREAELRGENASLRAELSQRTAERDEARREVSNGVALRNWRLPFDLTRRKYAAERGWDCFTAHANTTDVPVQDGGAA